MIFRHGILRSHPHGPMAKSHFFGELHHGLWFGLREHIPEAPVNQKWEKPWFESAFRKIHILIHRDI